jgi:putative inorganic carbon (HCO3(-)) transporter
VRLVAAMPVALSIPYIVLPLFPTFITLTAVTVPGVSLVPRPFAIGLLSLMAAIAVYLACMVLRPPAHRPPTMWPLLAWLGAVILSGMLGFNPAAGALFTAIFGLGLVWHFALLRYYSQSGVSRAIFWGYLLSGGLASLVAIAMVTARAPANQYAIGHGRAIGTFILPGELAGYLIVFLPITFVVARLARDRRMRIVAWCALVVGGVAFILTFSRAGWMGLAAAIAFYAFFTGAVRRRYAPLILLAGLAAVLVVFNVHHNPAENYTRLSIWQAGIEIARRFPLTGVGPFDFARIYPLVRLPDGDAQAFHAHSFLLTTFAETGLIGVLALLAAWWRFAVALQARLATAPASHAAIALAFAAGLAGTWVQGLIDTVSVVIFGLWLPSMALALATATDGLGDVG